MAPAKLEFSPRTCYLLAVTIVIVDQATKLMVEQFFAIGESVAIIETFNLVRLTFITNTGAAWGILRGYNVLLVSVALLVSLGCIWVIQTAQRRLIRLSAGCILGGGFGNMLDRLFLSSGVVDFIDIGIKRFRWPAFNVADTMLSVGMIIFAWAALKTELPLFNQSQTSSQSHSG